MSGNLTMARGRAPSRCWKVPTAWLSTKAGQLEPVITISSSSGYQTIRKPGRDTLSSSLMTAWVIGVVGRAHQY